MSDFSQSAAEMWPPVMGQFRRKIAQPGNDITRYEFHLLSCYLYSLSALWRLLWHWCTACAWQTCWFASCCTLNKFTFIIIIFFDPGTQFPRNEKITLYNIKKYKNQAEMNLTPPPPSQNSHAVRWHCTAESKRRVAEIKSWFLCRRPTDQQACDRVSKGRRDPRHWLNPMTQRQLAEKIWWAWMFEYFAVLQVAASSSWYYYWNPLFTENTR